MLKKTSTALRLTVSPYIGQTLILSMVTIFALWVAYAKQQWGFFWIFLVWVLWASYILFFGLKYRVYWNDVGVVMRASGGPDRHIGFSEITKIQYETAKTNEFLSQSRPFRRIVIFGDKHDHNARIDVSLRHFRIQDIKNLISAIGERRPDIKIPPIPFPHS
jgi:hypothetical protein